MILCVTFHPCLKETVSWKEYRSLQSKKSGFDLQSEGLLLKKLVCIQQKASGVTRFMVGPTSSLWSLGFWLCRQGDLNYGGDVEK